MPLSGNTGYISKQNNMATVSKDSVTDSELHVSFEDQQKINKFACYNAKLDDVVDELKTKENEQEALEEAQTDMMLVNDEKIPIGDVFVYFTMEHAEEMLEEKKKNVAEEISKLREEQDSIKQTMSELKLQLYAKFGNNINLEPE